MKRKRVVPAAAAGWARIRGVRNEGAALWSEKGPFTEKLSGFIGRVFSLQFFQNLCGLAGR